MIDSFTGQYKFLSNFYKVNICYDGFTYITLENAFQAAKNFDSSYKRQLQKCEPWEAKQAGGVVQLRSDWGLVKDDIMELLLFEKFGIEALCLKLLKTENEKLIEGNYWHDNYWGDCTCAKCARITGKNQLGRLLMLVRKIKKEDDDLNKAYRASGNCICNICGKKYYDHPMSAKYKSWQNEMYLHILCNGDLVKL
jgi:ribA/ribD-fused uncharacterized protein